MGKKKSHNTICFKGLVLNLSLFPYKIRYFFLTNFKTKEETCDFFPRKSVAFTLRISGIFFFFFPPLPGKCCNFSVKKNKTNKTLSFFFFNLRICYFVTFSLQIRLFLLICSLFGTWTTEFLISHKWSHLDILSLVAWGLRMALDTGLVVYVYSLHMIKETYLRS